MWTIAKRLGRGFTKKAGELWFENFITGVDEAAADRMAYKVGYTAGRKEERDESFKREHNQMVFWFVVSMLLLGLGLSIGVLIGNFAL